MNKIKPFQLRRHFITLIILLSFFSTTLTASELVFLTKPYLQNPTFDGMTVMWITNNKCFSWVQYGETEKMDRKAMNSSKGFFQANNTINKIHLNGLKPGTTYYYKVVSKEIKDFQPYKVTFGNMVESPVYHFRTPSQDDNTVSMLILNDIHDRPESFYKLMGLNPSGNNYDFVFLNGDILSHTSSEKQIIDDLITPCTNLFASEKPLMEVRGNHETRGALARNYYDYFQTDPENKGYYTFTRGPVFFIVLDTGEDKPDSSSEYSGLVDFDTNRKEEAIWLERQLQSKACKEARYRVVLMHIPPYYSGNWHGTTQARELFVPLFNKYNVNMEISAHVHKYGIHQPDAATHRFPIITGGGPEDGARTLIQLQADKSSLTVNLIRDNGQNVGTYRIAPNSKTNVNVSK